MATKMQQDTPLWIHDDGQVSCCEHFGGYARAELGRTPRARLLQTPLGNWQHLSQDDLGQLAEMIGRAPTCETCEADVRNRHHIQLVQ